MNKKVRNTETGKNKHNSNKYLQDVQVNNKTLIMIRFILVYK